MHLQIWRPFFSPLSNPSVLKGWTKRAVRGPQGTLTSYRGNICNHTQSYRKHIPPCWHRNSCPHSSSSSQSYEKMHDMPFFSFILHLVQFFFPSSVVYTWTPLLCIDLDPAAGSLKIYALFFFFALLVYLGPEWVQWGVFMISCVILSLILWRRPPSAVHPPSQDRAPPYVLASSCAAWTFGGWKCPSSPHHVCVEETFPPPTFTIQRREMNGNKIFSCHHPFLALCRQPHSVLRKLCAKEWLPVSSPQR